MLTFQGYVTEINVLSVYRKVASKVKSFLKGIKFGEKKKIKISVPIMMGEESYDIKSRLGYYSEYVTAYYLSDMIHKTKGNLTKRSDPVILKRIMDQKKQELKKLPVSPKEKAKLDQEALRMESAGHVMAKQIFEDLVLNGEDYPALEFDINLTGDSGKGVTKADLEVTVTKMGKAKIIDKINASLKAYKSGTINLSNSTFVSLFKTLFYDTPPAGNTTEFVQKFAKDFGSSRDLQKLVDLQNIIGTKIKEGMTKEEARKLAKQTHADVIETMTTIFKTHYNKNKKQINQRMLKMLGFDGEDDFYAAIGEAGKQKVVSSRKSTEMQKMLSDLQKGFNLTFERNKSTNNAFITFKSIDGTVITQANITFADTGGAKPQGKTNAFVNIGLYAK